MIRHPLATQSSFPKIHICGQQGKASAAEWRAEHVSQHHRVVSQAAGFSHRKHTSVASCQNAIPGTSYTATNLQRETLSLRSCVFSGRGTLESELEHMRPIKRGSGENCPQCPRITRPPLSLGKSHSLCAFEKGIPLVFCTPHRVREQVTTITPTLLGVFWRRRQGGFQKEKMLFKKMFSQPFLRWARTILFSPRHRIFKHTQKWAKS